MSSETRPVISTRTPVFIWRLWMMLHDYRCTDFIFWHESGESFIIPDPESFTKHVIPIYFRHSNYASFIRQLNLYGFRKVVDIRYNTISNSNSWTEFRHANFVREHPELLHNIERKKTSEARSGERAVDLNNSTFEDYHREMTMNMSLLQNQNIVLKEEIEKLSELVYKQTSDFNRLMQIFGRLMYYNGDPVQPFNNVRTPQLQLRTHNNSNNFCLNEGMPDFNDESLRGTCGFGSNFLDSSNVLPITTNQNGQVALYQPNYFNHYPAIAETMNQPISPHYNNETRPNQQLPEMPALALVSKLTSSESEEYETVQEELPNGRIVRRKVKKKI